MVMQFDVSSSTSIRRVSIVVGIDLSQKRKPSWCCNHAYIQMVTISKPFRHYSFLFCHMCRCRSGCNDNIRLKCSHIKRPSYLET